MPAPMPMNEEMTDEMPDESADQGGAQGICIELTCRSDGSFAVSTESIQEEAGEDQGDEGGQMAQSIGEALKLVMAAYKDWQTESGGSEGDAMAAGFNSVRGGSGQ